MLKLYPDSLTTISGLSHEEQPSDGKSTVLKLLENPWVLFTNPDVRPVLEEWESAFSYDLINPKGHIRDIGTTVKLRESASKYEQALLSRRDLLSAKNLRPILEFAFYDVDTLPTLPDAILDFHSYVDFRVLLLANKLRPTSEFTVRSLARFHDLGREKIINLYKEQSAISKVHLLSSLRFLNPAIFEEFQADVDWDGFLNDFRGLNIMDTYHALASAKLVLADSVDIDVKEGTIDCVMPTHSIFEVPTMLVS